MTNEINIGGSSYGPIASGRGARATQRDVTINAVSTSTDELTTALATLRELVETHADEIPDVDRVRKDVSALETESADPNRDKETMRDTIKRIIRRVGMVGVVVAAANDLREIVESVVS